MDESERILLAKRRAFAREIAPGPTYRALVQQGDVARPVYPPPREYKPPPPLMPPGSGNACPAVPVGNGADAAAAIQGLTAAVEAIGRQLVLIYRLLALTYMGQQSPDPTLFLPIVTGDTITTSYAALWQSIRQYPVSVVVQVDWATAGAKLRLSKSDTDNGWFADINNAGPTNLVGRAATLLMPNETLYAKDNGGGASPFAAGDKIHVMVCDPGAQLQDPMWTQALGFTTGGRP